MEYIIHSADAAHNRKLIEYINQTDSNNNGSAPAVRKISSDDDDVKILPEQSSTSNASKDRPHTAATDEKQRPAVTSQQNIPNVFGDEILAFLDSMDKPKKDEPNITQQKVETNSWRVRGNESQQTAKVEQWRLNTNSDKSNQNSKADPLNRSTNQTRAPVAQNYIPSDVKLTGAGIRPCPPYEFNNMYAKFPHLKAEKVLNPLKATPSQKPSAPAAHQRNERTTNSGLKEMSAITNSLTSLIGPKSSMDANRGRWASSNNLAGAARSTSSSAQHKHPSKDGNGAARKQQNTNGAQAMNDVNGSPNQLIENPVDTVKLKSKILNVKK